MLNLRNLLVVSGASALLLLQGGCGGAGADPQGRSTTPAPTSISVAAPTPMLDGASQLLKASLINGDGLHVQWSANAGTITQGGVFTAPGVAGTATVTASVLEAPSLTAVVQIPVRKLTVTLSPQNITLPPGGSVHFSPAVDGGLPSDSQVRWVVSAGTIDSFNIFTPPLEAGLYVVRAVSVSDPRKFDEVPVQVGSDLVVFASPKDSRIKLGEKLQFAAVVLGSSNQDVWWSSTSGSISNSGEFLGNALGSWTVTATSKANPVKSAQAIVTVFDIPPGITVYLTPSVVSIKAGDTFQFASVVSGTANQAVVWSCDGGSVDENGKYTAPLIAGKYTVLATSVVDPSKIGTSSVTVY